MTLAVPNLDDLRFQSDLVDEARKRIIRYCPEWTEYNISDPGITLIELFAWMTEMMVYRLNRVPEKNYLKFLEMLGFQLETAKTAEADITFWLSALLPLDEYDTTSVVVPAGTEVQSEDQPDPVVFTTSRDLKINAPLFTHLRSEANFNQNNITRLGVDVFRPFSKKPQIGDMFYLGFDERNNISGHILRFEFECEPTEAVGIRRENPPWVWECLTDDGWKELKLSTFEGERDTTGGLNNERGSLTIYTPLDFSSQMFHGLQAFWVRCRVEQRDPAQGMYTESPRITNLHVFTVGAQVPAANAQVVAGEVIGESNGEPGQRFKLQYAPVLNFMGEETVEVEETVEGIQAFIPWTRVDDFSSSDKFARHFMLDTANGEIIFGPSVRQPDGSMIQYGRIPESGKRIRVTDYRYGGGTRGNLPANAIDVMNTSLAYISRASNLNQALGGRDQETLEELIKRAQREIQSQRRAVTAADFEQFTLKSTRSVARTRCITPENSGIGAVTMVVVPDVVDSLKLGDLHALHISDELGAKIRGYLDKYRLLTTAINIEEPKYYGIKVKSLIVPQDFANDAEVATEVTEKLNRYLSPLKDESVDDEDALGWEFGRNVFTAEIISLIQKIPSVKYVLDTQVEWRAVSPTNEALDDFGSKDVDLQLVDKMLVLPPDGLVCSLRHEISVTSMEDYVNGGAS
ncbi:MAG: putative baseplate assembly protein [Anaerolineaceae bacterium]|nr:putative baseplate assembly protein [Anaerolineaceae bacterium]